jgi:hypothetical protein
MLLHKSTASRIMVLKHEIRAWKSRHNTASPSCRLPPETLSQVFLTLAASIDDPREWTNVTCVCRYWRSTALQCTGLWTNPPIINTFTEAILPRSKSAPISFLLVEQEGSAGEYKAIIPKVCSQRHRLKSFDVDSSLTIRSQRGDNAMRKLPFDLRRTVGKDSWRKLGRHVLQRLEGPWDTLLAHYRTGELFRTMVWHTFRA